MGNKDIKLGRFSLNLQNFWVMGRLDPLGSLLGNRVGNLLGSLLDNPVDSLLNNLLDSGLGSLVGSLLDKPGGSGVDCLLDSRVDGLLDDLPGCLPDNSLDVSCARVLEWII